MSTYLPQNDQPHSASEPMVFTIYRNNLDMMSRLMASSCQVSLNLLQAYQHQMMQMTRGLRSLPTAFPPGDKTAYAETPSDDDMSGAPVVPKVPTDIDQHERDVNHVNQQRKTGGAARKRETA
ncbi:hypothetical protein [Parvularcula sp. LCG005]|uniref:hypothetical protein n=1 Tax=Parvularcula sp. LCG005 TaxID=3078805 RepID=UPI002943E139|nr:hypothetical protein [Parvularcula sp. LCG005]WOI54670.1 hypothetical protein RUI03_06625 [Parvularcula sp. LCG005]